MSNRNPFSDFNTAGVPNDAPPMYTQESFAPPAGPPPPLNNASPSSQRPKSYAAPQSMPPPMSPSQGRPVSMQPTSAGTSGSGLNRSNTQENQLAVLKRFDTMILIDDSASMQPLWHEVAEAIHGLAEKVTVYDADGIDIYFLCSHVSQQNVRTADQANRLFQSVQPLGESTPTEVRVEELLAPYVDACERAKSHNSSLPKPVNLLVLTDGAADDPDSLSYAIAGFAERLEAMRAPVTQLGIQFVQIGDDAEAAEGLRALDDDLTNQHHVKRDIVDTTPYAGVVTAEFLLKALMGGINRRIDNRAVT